MSDLDLHVRSTLERTVATAPPPVPVETILARATPAAEPPARPHRRLAFALPALAVAGVFLALVVWPSDNGGPGPAMEVEATDTDPEPDSDAVATAITTTVNAEEGQWLSETIPDVAQQLPTVSADELWAALDRSEPDPPFAPSDADLEAVDVPGLTASRLRWEGLLSPTTYSISADTGADEIIAQMHDEFVRTVTDLGYQEGSEAFGLSPYELVVVASLIESADAISDDDRAKIARVLHNRLAQGLPLALDSAYVYAAQDRELEFTAELLDTPDPYGIRLSPGLPPTPIAAPSAAALRAAIDPATGSWLFYVVADEQGSHRFATTLDEHQDNITAARERGLLD